MRSVGEVVIGELAATRPALAPVMAAQLAGVVGTAGTRRRLAGREVLDIAVEHRAVADRIAADITDLYGYRTEVIIGRTPYRIVVRVQGNAGAVIRRVGLLERQEQLARVLPGRLMRGTPEELVALWRGAVMARGAVSVRRSDLSIACPTAQVAVALCVTARRVAIPAHASPTDPHRPTCVVVRGHAEVAAALATLGAPIARQHWLSEHRDLRPTSSPGDRNAATAFANEERSLVAARTTALRAQRALSILGDTAPATLRSAGQLRINHPDLGLAELARRAHPPISKSTLAGRLRRLLHAADAHAHHTGIPDTHSAVPTELRH